MRSVSTYSAKIEINVIQALVAQGVFRAALQEQIWPVCTPGSKRSIGLISYSFRWLVISPRPVPRVRHNVDRYCRTDD